jgi:hypothetical protein
MSKHRTIGENPLDLVVSENHLEAVVSRPISARERPVPAPAHHPDLEQRLADLESENKKLKLQVNELRSEMADLKNQAFRTGWWVSQIKQKLGVK